MKKCDVCKKDAPFYWNKPSGTIHLCSDHYDAMEREVHQKEKANRLITMTMGVITGKEHDFIKCPNGENCRWCLEVGLASQKPK